MKTYYKALIISLLASTLHFSCREDVPSMNNTLITTTSKTPYKAYILSSDYNAETKTGLNIVLSYNQQGRIIGLYDSLYKQYLVLDKFNDYVLINRIKQSDTLGLIQEQTWKIYNDLIATYDHDSKVIGLNGQKKSYQFIYNAEDISHITYTDSAKEGSATESYQYNSTIDLLKTIPFIHALYSFYNEQSLYKILSFTMQKEFLFLNANPYTYTSNAKLVRTLNYKSPNQEMLFDYSYILDSNNLPTQIAIQATAKNLEGNDTPLTYTFSIRTETWE